MNELVRFALVAFFPRVDDVPGLDELGVDDKIAMLRRDASPIFWLGVVGAAFFFQIAPILTVHRPWPAALLTPAQLDQHAYKLGTHPVYLIRQMAVLLKLVAGLFWGQSPEIRAMINLPPYGPDPGTRRTEAMVARPTEVPRAPVDALVQLGRREEERGRGRSEHALAEGKVA